MPAVLALIGLLTVSCTGAATQLGMTPTPGLAATDRPAASPTANSPPTAKLSPTVRLEPTPTLGAAVVGAAPAVPGWLADYRPQWMAFVTSDGARVIVQPDGLGSTKATQDRMSVVGHAPGDAILVT